MQPNSINSFVGNTTTPAIVTVGVNWPPASGILGYSGSIAISCPGPLSCQSADVPVSFTLRPGISSIANCASFTVNSLSPGSFATIFGTNLVGQSNSSSFSSLPLPKTLGGAIVTVNGISAPLLYASPTQINFQIPYETTVGTASVIVNAGYASSTPFSAPIAAASPGIFSFGTNRAVAQNPDGSLNDSNNGVGARLLYRCLRDRYRSAG